MERRRKVEKRVPLTRGDLIGGGKEAGTGKKNWGR